MQDKSKASAYGGPRWSPRTDSLQDEIGTIWSSCGINCEWAPLKAVLLHRPGAEFDNIRNPDEVQMLESPNIDEMRRQHDTIAEAYRKAGISVTYVDPVGTPTPNTIFVADLMFMTPEGAILARPASTVRAGEERFVARRLADMGIPIILSIRGKGTFEGADAAWINPDCVMIGTGQRTNQEGAAQITQILQQMDVEVAVVNLPIGAMHLMGSLRFVDNDLAICWSTKTPYAAVQALRDRGYEVLLAPDEGELNQGMSLNYVSMGPRNILMAAKNPVTQAFYEQAGIKCQEVEINEILKAAGGIGCLTGVVERKLV
jgi:N-dimethylarginine dimethylaminohydrolase